MHSLYTLMKNTKAMTKITLNNITILLFACIII